MLVLIWTVVILLILLLQFTVHSPAVDAVPAQAASITGAVHVCPLSGAINGGRHPYRAQGSILARHTLRLLPL